MYARLRGHKAAWSGFFAALEVFKAGGSAMTGRPRPPDYLAEHDRFVVELPLTQLGALLGDLGQRTIPQDFAESCSLNEAELDAWNSYRIEGALATACVCTPRLWRAPGAAPAYHFRTARA